MKCLSLIIICFVLCVCPESSGQRFSCDGQLLIATSDGVSTKIARPFYVPFGTPFLSQIVSYTGGKIDGLGFNSLDNYIYGTQANSNAIVRLKRDNSFDVVGVVDLVDSLKVNAGDCTVDGLYLCYEETLNQLLLFSVVDEFKLLQQLDLFWDPDSPNSGRFETSIFDFAIDPNNPKVAYAYQGTHKHVDLEPALTQGQLLTINLDFDDPAVGMVTPVTEVSPDLISHLGALLFSARGELHGYGTAEAGLNPVQRKLVTINTVSGDVSQILQEPKAIISDGCSCPYTFSFANSVPTEGMYCNGDAKTFVLTITNNSYNTIENVTLVDTFPEGVIIEEVLGILKDNVASIRGIGSNLLEISGLDLLPRTVIDIEIKVSTSDAPVGVIYNQAFLYNLPDRFEGYMPSDDLGTTGAPGDASRFSIIPRNLEDVTYEVKSPTDCIVANDGEIRISSPQFIPGEPYEIKIRNKVGWEESTYQVLTGQDNSMLIDSLVPGNYQFFQLRSMNDNCGLAIKDFTILLEAPNELLELDISSASPICAGEELALISRNPDVTSIRWTGPSLFGADEPNPTIFNTDSSNSGNYNVVAEYGYCKQYDTLEVIVNPLVSTSIVGDTQFCERSNLLLEAIGMGDDLTHEWTGPNNARGLASSLVIDEVSVDQEGYYEVISSNGACRDTIGVEIEVVPTPSISLPDVIVTDFCETVILSPTSVVEDDLSYSWFPEEGLSCIDCPNPELESMLQSSYKVVAQNEYLCIDSAEVSIVLDKEDLVYIPNVFLANDAGANGNFGVFPGCAILNINDLKIFDRWGSTVFESKANSLDEVMNA